MRSRRPSLPAGKAQAAKNSHSSSGRKVVDAPTPYALLPQVEKAWNFPLFEAIVGRRSRRFGFGMELGHGPFSYKSDKAPVPLDEAETAILIAAATGVTGALLCYGEFQCALVK